MNSGVRCRKQNFNLGAKHRYVRTATFHGAAQWTALASITDSSIPPHLNIAATKNQQRMSKHKIATRLMDISVNCRQIPPPATILSKRCRQHEGRAA